MKIVNVTCLVTPDGKSHHFRTDEHSDGYLKDVVESWHEQNPNFPANCTIGAVNIWMPAGTFDAIPPTDFKWPSVHRLFGGHRGPNSGGTH